MKLGTRSVLFGVHSFFVHPMFVLRAWLELYGCLPSWREALCILVHDLGYLGCRTMDGPDGERHPELGARIADALLGRPWGDFVRGHSRTYARLLGVAPSRLCGPDKLSSALYPAWLYLALARASGELAEYRVNADDYDGRTGRGCPAGASDRAWLRWMQDYMRKAARDSDGHPPTSDPRFGVSLRVLDRDVLGRIMRGEITGVSIGGGEA